MKKQKLLICDEDQSYVSAFVNYLVEEMGNYYIISSFSDPNTYSQHTGNYDIGILNDPFLDTPAPKIQIACTLHLQEQHADSRYPELPKIYKYQSMEKTIEIISSMQIPSLHQEDISNGVKDRSKVIGVYSPIGHELQMPYALTLSQILGQKGKTLFIDLEDLSMLAEFIECSTKQNLYDLFYIMEGQSIHQIPLEDFIISHGNLDILTGFVALEEMNEVTREQWLGLMELLCQRQYEYVVILFGRVLPGFSQLLSACSQVLLLNKPGEYYDKYQWVIQQYLKQKQLQQLVKEVSLPMSAMNLTIGAYLMEELCQGNMGRFIRRQIEGGEIHG